VESNPERTPVFEDLLCPRCKGAYFLQPKRWNADGEVLRIDDDDTPDGVNPLTLLCAHCGVCLQRQHGEFVWVKKGDDNE
jgi:hypothetical protein